MWDFLRYIWYFFRNFAFFSSAEWQPCQGLETNLAKERSSNRRPSSF